MHPYLLLAVGIAWLASVAGAYYKGGEVAENRMRAEHASQLEKTIAQHNADSLIDMQAALEAGQREAKVRTKVVTLTNEVERVIREKPAPADCRVQPDTLRLLQLAVSIANGTDKDTASTVPTGTGKTPTTDKP